MKVPEVAPPPATMSVDEKIVGRSQLGSSGPNGLKVIVPVGLNAPDNVAESLIDPPATTAALAVVVNVGLARDTTTLSPGSPQAVDAVALLVSPPYLATKS